MRPQAEHHRLPEPLGEGRGNRAATAGTPGRAARPPQLSPRTRQRIGSSRRPEVLLQRAAYCAPAATGTTGAAVPCPSGATSRTSSAEICAVGAAAAGVVDFSSSG
jgi:hypothetical protein